MDSLELAKRITRFMGIEEPVTQMWRRMLPAIRKLRGRRHRPLIARRFDGQNQQTAIAKSPPKERKVDRARVLYQLKNYRSADTLLQTVDPYTLRIDDLVLSAKIMLHSVNGLLADDLLHDLMKRLLPESYPNSKLIAIADWVAISGLSIDQKLEYLAFLGSCIKNEEASTESVRDHLEFRSFKLREQTTQPLDALSVAHMDSADLSNPTRQMRYLPALRSQGYSAVCRAWSQRALDFYGSSRPDILAAACKDIPETAAPYLDQLDLRFLSRNDILQVTHDFRGAHPIFETAFGAGIEYRCRGFPETTPTAQDSILRLLIKYDLFNTAENLVADSPRLSPLILPVESIRGLQDLRSERFIDARGRFLKVLEEDPSDAVAAQGARLAMPRTGGQIISMLELRNRVGFGITSKGRPGARADIGSEKTIGLMMSGRYLEGLYTKRHSLHWKILKQLYKSRFYNYEALPTGKGQSLSLFVIGDEGVGDEVRTAQFYQSLSNAFSQVTITCDPRLYSIFSRSFPDIRFIPVQRYRKGLDSQSVDGSSRIQGLNEKLSHLLTEDCRTDLDTADVITFGQNLFFNYFAGNLGSPRTSGYLLPRNTDDPKLIPREGKLAVGLLWRSHMQTMWRRFMYLGLEDFSQILERRDIDFWSIQHHATDAEEKFCRDRGVRLIDDIDLFNDFEGLAEYLKCLDLVVGISSLPAELAAAIGTPIWLLGFSPENYFLRTAGGSVSTDQLSCNSKIIAPPWIDFSSPSTECIGEVMKELNRQMDVAIYE